MKICLIIIYNHQYENNIQKINKYYENRFCRIVHLMPFYEGNDINVIPIYESSYSFSGYIAQGSRDFISEEYDYYVFCGDDCILNPDISESNLIQKFELEGGKGFIKELDVLDVSKIAIQIPLTNYLLTKNGIINKKKFDGNDHLLYIRRAYGKLKDTRELEIQKYIPSKEEMIEILKRHGIKWHKNIEEYPLVLSFSDLVIVPASNIKSFCRLCGAFAAANLHVELAIPTALTISCKDIVTEKDLRRGKYGSQNHVNTRIKKLSNIKKCFKDKNCLYIHPIKLSTVKEL